MKKLILVAVAGLMLSGCVNMYARMPGTKAKITDTYQPTQLAADGDSRSCCSAGDEPWGIQVDVG